MKKVSILLWMVIGFMILGVSADSGMSDWKKAGGSWVHDESIRGSNKESGDSFYLSDKYVDGSKSFVFQCDFEMSGRACGIVFGAKNRQNPSQSWYCLNYDKIAKSARAFFVKGGLKWNISYALNDDVLSKQKHSFKVVFVQGAEMTFYVDDISIGGYSVKDFEGGYLGVMTCFSDATFSNVSYKEFTPKRINSLDFLNIEFDKKYNDSVNEYLAYVEYDKNELKLKAEFDSDIVATVNDKEISSGKAETVPLHIGCNQIKLSIKYEVESTEIKSTKYLIVHRKQQQNLLYKEEYRPQLHYTSAYEWINDPNGMVYNAATKEYHLFYQTRPRTSVSEPNQSWYHAISKDLVHWEQVQPALTPDELGFCWSGSGNIDRYNTSKLFDEDTSPEGRMVLIYSSVYGDTYYGVEKISLAYSNDNGITWNKYEGNPIIKNGENYKQEYNDGFRDPKLVWYEDDSNPNGGTWIMLVGGGQGRLFQSDNLIDWTFQSAMTGVDGKPLHGECPDLFEIEVKNEPGVKKWVYISGKLDLEKNPMVFQTTATIGNITRDKNGKFVFIAESDTKQVLYGGYCMYATQSFASTANGRRIQISWLRDSLIVTGADKKDTEIKDWTGCMSWPLELSLYNKNGNYVLTSYPIEEMKTLRGNKLFDKKDVTIEKSINILNGVKGKFFEIECTIDVSKANETGFIVRQHGDNGVVIKCTEYSKEEGTVKVTIDASRCGTYNGETNSVIASAPDGKIVMKIVVDTSVIDVFLNNGESSVFALAYPEYEFEDMNLYVKEGSAEIESIQIYELKSIWGKEKIIKKTSRILNYALYIIISVLSITFFLLVLSLFRKPSIKKEVEK